MTTRDDGFAAPADTPQARAALHFARRGWLVLPCVPRGKVPLLPNGFHGASADLETVAAWWRAEPEANVALVPGRAELPGGDTLIVIDCDGPRGLATARAYGVPVRTATVTTGRQDGGEHRYFTVPAGVVIGNRALALGVDVRHAAGYVLAPPSVHPTGAAYVWNGAPAWAPGAVLPLPAALIELLTAKRRHDGAPSSATVRAGQRAAAGGPYPVGHLGARGMSDATTWRRLGRYLEKVPTGLADGRKTVGYRLAAALVHDFALGESAAWAVLAAWNADNAPPLHDDELARLLANATKYGKGSGRQSARRTA